MVKKVWQECRAEKFSVSHRQPEIFTRCQWQRAPRVSSPYVCYRWMHALMFGAMTLASFAGAGRVPGPLETDLWAHYGKWFVYLTHWGLMTCTLQAWLAVVLIMERRQLEAKEAGHNTLATNCMTVKHKVYWVTHTIATTVAISITMIYWFIIYEAASFPLDTLNFLAHAVNSVLMVIDLAVVAHPQRLLHVYWPVSFTLSYMVFSLVYYWLGGTSRDMEVFIYKALNWSEVGKSSVFCVVGFIFLVVVHSTVYGLFRLRRFVHGKCFGFAEKTICDGSSTTIPERAELIV